MAEIRRWRIEGRVQGVFFRASTRSEAERLGLTGHALNCPDGTVDVLAAGHRDALDELEAWLHSGPPAARVDRVEARSPDRDTLPPGFRTD